jgi:hypothetical protein
MEKQWLPPMNVLEDVLKPSCHRKLRSNSLGTTADSEAYTSLSWMTPRPPPPDKHMELTSYSESKSYSKRRYKDNLSDDDDMFNPITSEKSSYIFHCKNASPNLHTIMKLDPTVDSVKHTADMYEYDAMEHIIPEYYIDNTGIKSGALTFDYYDTIVDSIRNLRSLTRHQKLYLNTISHDQLIRIIYEYNDTFDNDTDSDTKLSC